MIKKSLLNIYTIIWTSVFALVIAIVSTSAGSLVKPLLSGVFNNSPIADEVIDLWGTIVTPIIFVLWYTIRHNKSELAIVIPLKKKLWFPKYLLSWLVGGSALLIIWLIAIKFNAFSLKYVWKNSNFGWLIAFIIGYCFQGMNEEIICRGFMQGKITKNIGPKTGIIVSSIFFAVFHGLNSGMTVVAFINLVIYALAMSLLRYGSNNLWLCAGIHSAWNFTQGTVCGVLVSGSGPSMSIFTSKATSGKVWANGGSFGLEGSILCTIIYSIILIGVWLIWFRKGKQKDHI